MLHPLLLTALCAAPDSGTAAEAAAAVLPPSVTAVHAVQDDEKPDKRPEVKELLDQLDAHAKKRGEEDQQAIAVVDQLVQEFAKSGLKDREDIAEGIADCLKEKRQETDGVPDNKLYIACATALGQMGPESVPELIGWIGHKQHRKDIELQRRLILSLGQTRHEKAVEPLIDLLVDKTPSIQAAAAEALGNFDREAGFDSDARKNIFEEVLKVVTSVKNQVDADVNDLIARERYDAIAASMVTTLSELSGHDERDPSAWTHWWNKNKREDWDAED